jgi:hypothetical protein
MLLIRTGFLRLGVMGFGLGHIEGRGGNWLAKGQRGALNRGCDGSERLAGRAKELWQIMLWHFGVLIGALRKIKI